MPRTLKVGIERDGRDVLLALATAHGPGPRATLRTSARAGAALATNLRAASEADETFDSEFQITGDLETESTP